MTAFHDEISYWHKHCVVKVEDLIKTSHSLRKKSMIKIYSGLIVFAVTLLVGSASVEAQCAYSSGYSSYSPSYQYSNSYYAPSYNYNRGYSSPSYGYNNTRSQRIRRVATVALVVGAAVAISNSGNNRNRRRRH